MLSWAQIVTVSQAEARQDILELLDGVGFAATSWQEGSIPLALTEIGAFLWSKSTEVSVYLKNAYLNETSSGTGLERFSVSHYQNTRRDAVAAQRLQVLTCDPDEGPYTINAGDFRASNGAFEFTNVPDENNVHPTSYPLTIPAGGSVSIILQADIAGEDANTQPGGVNRIITTLVGVTIESDEPLRTGVNQESEASLKRRNELKWALLTRYGLTDDAVEALVRDTVEAVDRVHIDSTNPRGPGTFDVYVTGVSGNLTADEKSRILTRIRAYIMHDRETAVQVLDAPLAPLNITGQAYVTSEFDWDSVVLPAILAALEAWRRTIPLGGFPYPMPGAFVPLNEIETVIRKVKIGDKEPVKTVKLSAPSGDTAVASFAHVTQGTWTLNEIFVV